MSSITPKQREKMRHALGLDMAPQPYRNRYATQPNDLDWEALVAGGWAAVAARTKHQIIYGVTDEGLDAIGVRALGGLEPNERYRAGQTYCPNQATSQERSDG